MELNAVHSVSTMSALPVGSVAVSQDYCCNASNLDCTEGNVTLELAGLHGPEGHSKPIAYCKTYKINQLPHMHDL